MQIWKPIAMATFAACALVSGSRVRAQDGPAPIIHHDFEQNEGGWQGVGDAAAVSLTHDPNSVKSGKGALQYAYELKKGSLNILLLPTPDMALARAKSIHFWVKTDHAAPLSCVLQEKAGGRYNSVFSTQKDVWQEVVLSTADFVLDSSKTSPKDPDGKLDMDQVEGAAIVDIAQLFIQGDAGIATAFGISAGKRTLFLDDFSVSSSDVPHAISVTNGEGAMDTFSHPQVGWIAIGQVQLSHAVGQPLEGPGMQARYHQAPASVIGLSKFVPLAALAGATKLKLSAASLKPAKIVVQVEERGGGKYNTTVELPGNSGRADLTLNFADFKAAQDSQDDNNKLDLDQVTQILFFDATGLLDNTDADNVLWLNAIKAVR